MIFAVTLINKAKEQLRLSRFYGLGCGFVSSHGTWENNPAVYLVILICRRNTFGAVGEDELSLGSSG